MEPTDKNSKSSTNVCKYIEITALRNDELVRSVRKHYAIVFLNYWNKKSKEPEGKLDTYFKIKKMFLSGNIFIY
jgi:hypothetical protein